MSRLQSAQYLAGAICFMLLAFYFWRWRRFLNSHVDMLLIMCASGGLGMLLGMPMPSHAAHSANSAALWRMCVWMFVFGFAPALLFSRCMRTAYRHGYLLWALLIDCSAMLAGMWISSQVRLGHEHWTAIGRHLTMLGGMTVGMIFGMWIRSALFRKRLSQTREWKPADARTDASGTRNRYSRQR